MMSTILMMRHQCCYMHTCACLQHQACTLVPTFNTLGWNHTLQQSTPPGGHVLRFIYTGMIDNHQLAAPKALTFSVLPKSMIYQISLHNVKRVFYANWQRQMSRTHCNWLTSIDHLDCSNHALISSKKTQSRYWWICPWWAQQQRFRVMGWTWQGHWQWEHQTCENIIGSFASSLWSWKKMHAVSWVEKSLDRIYMQ